jgi:hypothetical protein
MTERERFEAWMDDCWKTFKYDPATGSVTVVKPYQQHPFGSILGSDNGQGYLRASFKGRRFLLHQMAWFLFYEEWPTMDIDHKNRDKHDNKISNLRLATFDQNRQNVVPQKTTKTGLRGVHRRSTDNLIQASISVNGKSIHLGTFKKCSDAAKAYNDAAIKFHGEFAVLNQLENQT